MDLIAGLPHQTQETWRASLDQLLAIRPEHISIYLLEIDEGSRLGKGNRSRAVFATARHPFLRTTILRTFTKLPARNFLREVTSITKFPGGRFQERIRSTILNTGAGSPISALVQEHIRSMARCDGPNNFTIPHGMLRASSRSFAAPRAD